MKTLLCFFLLLVSFASRSQSKVTAADVDKSFSLIFSNPKQAKLNLDALEIQAINQKDSLYGIILNSKGIYYATQTQLDSALIYFYKSRVLANNASKRFVGTQTNIAIIYKKKGDLDKALRLLEANLLIANQKKYNAARATIYGELASCYSEKEWYKQALEHLIQSIELWSNENPIPNKKIAVEKQKLANLYLKMANTPKALLIANEIAPVFKEAGNLHDYYLTQITISTIYIEQNKWKKALQLLEQIIPKLSKLNDKELLHYAYNNQAKSIEKSGSLITAKQKYLNTIVYGFKYEQVKTVVTVAQAGNLLMALNDTIALRQLKKKTETAMFQKLVPLASSEDKLQYYLWMKRYGQLVKDKLVFETSKEKADNLKFLLKEKQNLYQAKELQVATDGSTNTQTNESKTDLNTFGKYFILFVFILFAIALMIKRKGNNKMHALNNQTPNSIVGNKTSNNSNFKQVLPATTATANGTSSEIELFDQTCKKLKLQLASNNDANYKPRSEEETRMQKDSKITDRNFVDQFQKLNKEFVDTLQNKYPNLSKSEIRFCCLIKLYFSNKEIAQFTNISVESVISKKYRIVKKSGLKKEVDFYEWLKNEC